MAAAFPACYHGAISMQECEELLGRKHKDGAYLIRDSGTIQGALCLCVYKQRVVYTYRVLRTHSGHYTVVSVMGREDIVFKTLDDLVHHYKRKNQGLAMHLRHAVKRKTALLIQPHTHPEQLGQEQGQRQEQEQEQGRRREQEQGRRKEQEQGRRREQKQGRRREQEQPRLQLAFPEEEEHDYENAPASSSEYVKVLPQ